MLRNRQGRRNDYLWHHWQLFRTFATFAVFGAFLPMLFSYHIKKNTVSSLK